MFTVTAENGKKVSIDDGAIKPAYPEDYLFPAKGVAKMVGENILSTAQKAAKKLLSRKARPLPRVVDRTTPKKSRTPYNPKDTLAEPAYKSRRARRKAGTEQQPSPVQQPVKNTSDIDKVLAERQLRLDKPSGLSRNKKLGVAAGLTGATYVGSALLDDDDSGNSGADIESTLLNGSTPEDGAPPAASATQREPYLRLLAGTDNAFVDENGQRQLFSASDPEKNKQLRSKILVEQGDRGNIAASVLPSVYSDPANRPAPARTAVAGEDSGTASARSAILSKGLELLDKANTTDQLNAVTNLLSSAGGSGRAPKQVEPVDALAKQKQALDLSLSQARLDKLQEPKRVQDSFGYAPLISNIAKGDTFDAEGVAETLGLSPDAAPSLYVDDGGVPTLSKSKLYMLLLQAKSGGVPPNKLSSLL